MEDTRRTDTWWWLLIVLLVLLPLAVLFLTPGGALIAGPFWFWLALLICFWVLLSMAPAAPQTEATDVGPRMLPESEQPEAVRAVMRVDIATEQPDGTLTFRGRLRAPAETAYARLRTELPSGLVPLLLFEVMSVLTAALLKPSARAVADVVRWDAGYDIRLGGTRRYWHFLDHFNPPESR